MRLRKVYIIYGPEDELVNIFTTCEGAQEYLQENYLDDERGYFDIREYEVHQ